MDASPTPAVGKRVRDDEDVPELSPSMQARLRREKITKTVSTITERDYDPPAPEAPPTSEASSVPEALPAELAPPTQSAPAAERRLPSMAQRSRAEVVMFAHTLCLVLGQITVDGLLDAMSAGDRAHKADGMIESLNMAFEYDDATWHGMDSIGRDVRKTEKLLLSMFRVLRVRVGDAPPLPADNKAIADPDCVIVETRTRSVKQVIREICKALVRTSMVTGPVKQRLQEVARAGYVRDSKVDDVIHETFLRIDHEYKKELDKVAGMLDGDETLARTILAQWGVKTRLGTGAVASTLNRLKAMGLTPKEMAMMGNSGFWCKAGTEAMDATLALLAEMGVKRKQLHTLSCECFWAKAGKPAMRDTLEMLLKMGVRVEHLHTFGGGFWAKAGTAIMAATFERLFALGVRADDLKSFGNGFWSLTGHEVMTVVLAKLVALGVAPEHFKIFGHICCFWSSMKTTGLDVLETLSREYGVATIDLHKFHDAFWTHVAKEDNWAALKATLATLDTTDAVNARLRELNKRPAIGQGATKCYNELPMPVSGLVLPPYAGQGRFYSEREGKRTLALLQSLGATQDVVNKLLHTFWAKMKFHYQVVPLLVNEYGVPINKLPTFRDFWSKLQSQSDVDKLARTLATCDTTDDVNYFLLWYNNDAHIGATKCYNELPIPVSSLVPPPHAKANRQQKRSPREVANTLVLLQSLGVTQGVVNTLPKQFWEKLRFHDFVVPLLVDEYGVPANTLQWLHAFWAQLKDQSDVDTLARKLARLATPRAVTAHLRSLNNNEYIGGGATKCKHTHA